MSYFANQLTKDTKITVVATRYLVDSNQVAVVQDQTDTGEPTTDEKAVANIIQYVDQDGHAVKDKDGNALEQLVSGKAGDQIQLQVPAGYHVDGGNLPSLTISSKTPVQKVAVVQDQTDTDVPKPGVKDALNIINYVDEHGNVVKHDTVTGDEGDPIEVAIPAGYRIEDGNMPAFVIDSHNPVHIVTITKDQHDTDNPEVVTKPLLNIIKYVDEHGNVVKTETVNGNLGDQITLTLPAGYHFKNVETPNLVITESGVQIVNVVKDRQVTPGNPTINDNNKNGNNSVVDNKDASQDNNGKIVSAAAMAQSNNANKHKQSQLPQTGNESHDNFTVAGLALASLAGLIGLAGFKKKHD